MLSVIPSLFLKIPVPWSVKVAEVWDRSYARSGGDASFRQGQTYLRPPAFGGKKAFP